MQCTQTHPFCSHTSAKENNIQALNEHLIFFFEEGSISLFASCHFTPPPLRSCSQNVGGLGVGRSCPHNALLPEQCPRTQTSHARRQSRRRNCEGHPTYLPSWQGPPCSQPNTQEKCVPRTNNLDRKGLEHVHKCCNVCLTSQQVQHTPPRKRKSSRCPPK